MASEEIHLDFCLANLTIKSKMLFDEDHLFFCLTTVTKHEDGI
jgi:hypothetical protein